MLTIQRATVQARAKVDKVFPQKAGATVSSRLSHDLATDKPIVITTITYPQTAAGEIERLKAHLSSLAGFRQELSTATCHGAVVTRER